ncbi:diguanylate cyclase [Dehalobacter sp. DCM]|uniref:HD domain-containing phosphohydrolase n=1 Tax=Dehalobacter sp. DCM TaxID=2907827 RepID=UPI0030821D42|nr:diguanylate cyclase [Dehalobacter sp. DCM]
MESGQVWLKTTLATIDDAVILTDNQNKIQLISKKAEGLSGWTSDEVIGKSLGDILLVKNSTIQCKNGEKRSVKIKSAPVSDNDNHIHGMVFLINGSVSGKKKIARAHYANFHDPVTGLYNRRFFEEELKRLNTERNLPISLAVIDINHLELMRQELGTTKANSIIKKIAKIIKDECRTDDIIARVSDEEIVILLPKTTAAQAQVLVKRLNELAANAQLDSLNIDIKPSSEINASDDGQDNENKPFHPLVQIIIETLYKRNPNEKVESETVSFYAAEIGRAVRLGDESIRSLKTLSRIRNIGEVSLDPRIITKQDVLTDSERAEIKRHPEIGHNIINSIPEYANLAESILGHHERWDGTGYPQGLKGIEIPLEARIIAIADAYNAMTSHRPYRAAFEPKAAAEEILKNAGAQFDPMLAKLFVNSIL